MQVYKFKRVVGIFVGLTLFFVLDSSVSIATDGHCCQKFDKDGRLASRACVDDYNSYQKDAAEKKGWECFETEGPCKRDCPTYPISSPITIRIITKEGKIYGLEDLVKE